MFWKDDVDVSLLSYSIGHIDVKVTRLERGEECYFTGFYGNPVVDLRQILEVVGKGGRI